MKSMLRAALFSSAILSVIPAMADVHIAWQSNAPDITSIYHWNQGKTTKLADASWPQLSGSRVAWVGTDSTVNVWQAGTTRTVATNAFYNPIAFDGNNIVYRTTNDNMNLYNGTTTKSIYVKDSELFSPTDPKISGSTVVWGITGRGVPRFDSPYQIYNGSTTQDLNVLTNTSPSFQLSPVVSGNNVVWGHNIYPTGLSYLDFWNGTTHQTIKSDTHSFTNPQMSGNNVVCQGDNGTNSDIFMWNGTQVKQITQTSFPQINPQISGNNVVWQGFDGNDNEIYFWDGVKIQQLTNNTIEDITPKIAGNQVVWTGFDGNDDEIFWWNGNTKKTTQVTKNNVHDGYALISETPDAAVANGTYLIKNKQSGKFLNRAGASTENGTLIQQWSCNTCTENKWKLEKLSTGQYTLTAVNKATAALDIAGASIYDGANVQLWTYWSEAAHQQFNLTPAAKGGFYIAPSHVTNKVIGITDKQKFNGAIVTQQTKNDTANQQWIFVPVK